MTQALNALKAIGFLGLVLISNFQTAKAGTVIEPSKICLDRIATYSATEKRAFEARFSQLPPGYQVEFPERIQKNSPILNRRAVILGIELQNILRPGGSYTIRTRDFRRVMAAGCEGVEGYIVDVNARWFKLALPNGFYSYIEIKPSQLFLVQPLE